MAAKKPEFPCDPKVAIEWAAGKPAGVRWEVIEDAFIHFLAFEAADSAIRSGRPDGIIKDTPAKIKSLLRDWSRPEGLTDAQWKARRDKAIASNDELIARFRDDLNQAQALKKFCRPFLPGADLPDWIIKLGYQAYRREWDHPEIRDCALLANLDRFRLFLKQHKYPSLWKSKKPRAAPGKVASDNGRAARTKNKWRRFTVAFAEFAKGREITTAVIASFPKQDKVPHASGRHFLTRLLEARGKLASYAGLWQTLLNIPKEVAEECSAILFPENII